MPRKNRADNAYYGWYIAVTLAFTETISWGILYYAFTVFIHPMEAELGWSRTELTAGFSLALLIMGGMAFLVGSWIDRYGSRWLMTIGSILASLLVIAWSQVTTLPMFYLIWAGIGVCGALVLYEPAFTVIAAWFVKRRSTALAIITFAAGFASTIFIPLTDVLYQAFGWRTATFMLGILLAVTTIPLHALILRRRPADLGLLPDGDPLTLEARPMPVSLSLSDALNSRFFWLMTLAFGLASLAANAIRVHFIPFLVDSGIASGTAALASGSIGIMQVLGRVIFAPLDSRIPGKIMVAGVFALQGVGMFALLWGASPLTIILFVGVFGAAYGAITLARASIIAELFGSAHYGRISSVMAFFLTFAGTTAPVGASWLYDYFGNYQPVLWGVLLLALLATGIMLMAKPDATLRRKFSETESITAPIKTATPGESSV